MKSVERETCSATKCAEEPLRYGVSNIVNVHGKVDAREHGVRIINDIEKQSARFRGREARPSHDTTGGDNTPGKNTLDANSAWQPISN